MRTIKYFFEFIFIISFFSIFKIIGLRSASLLGSFLGKIIGPLFRSKNIIDQNIKIASNKIDPDKQAEIISGMWSNIGRTFAEYAFLREFRFKKKFQNNVSIIGIENLEQIKKENRPVVFFSGHFANFELMAMQLEKNNMKFAAIYRPLNNFFLNPLMEYCRMKYICPNQIPKGRMAAREIINKVKNGYSIALMVDQRVGEGLKVDFFNHPAQTTTIPAQIAMKYDCKLVPISLKRIHGVNFEMTVHKPYVIEKTGNDNQDTHSITLKINQIIEEMITQNPTQWLWPHNRWK